MTVCPLPREDLVVTKWRKGQTLGGRRALGGGHALAPPLPEGLGVGECVGP